MASTASPLTVLDSPSTGTRSKRRTPDADTRAQDDLLVIPIGRRAAANQPGGTATGPSSEQQQQPQQQQQAQPAQQQQPPQRRQRQQAATDDIIVIGSDSDSEDDEVVITGVTVGQKRPRPVVPQQQQRQVQHQQQQRHGMPPVPTWHQPAAPARPPSPEPAFKCLICLDGIKPDNMATTPCGHMFCFDCITDAVKVTKKCPKCRKSTTLKAIKRLYPN